MKKIYFGILCCLLGFTTSCSDDDNATALLQIDPSTDLVFEAVGGTRTIEVKTDQATWQVESNQTWCKVEKSDGTLKCTPNIGRISICLDGMSSVLYRAHVV